MRNFEDELQELINAQKELLGEKTFSELTPDEIRQFSEKNKEIGKMAYEAYEAHKEQSAEDAIRFFYIAYDRGYKDAGEATYKAREELVANQPLADQTKELDIQEEDSEKLYNSGMQYLLGLGVDQRLDQAKQHFEKAANADYAPALIQLHLLQKKESKSIKFIQKAAELGHCDAQFRLGYAYRKGWYGCQFDDEKAFELFNKAAEKGRPDAQFYLGSSYNNGRGCIKNIDQALKWYEIAAENGDVDAQANLSAIYLRDGVKQNEKLGFEWLKKAAENGDVESQCNLAFAYYQGVITPKDESLAYSWFKKVVDSKSLISEVILRAKFYLAKMYLDSNNQQLGIFNYQNAARLFREVCVENSEYIIHHGLPTLVDFLDNDICNYHFIRLGQELQHAKTKFIWRGWYFREPYWEETTLSDWTQKLKKLMDKNPKILDEAIWDLKNIDSPEKIALIKVLIEYYVEQGRLDDLKNMLEFESVQSHPAVFAWGLVFAIKAGKVDFVTMFLEQNGINVNERGKYERTPLHEAAQAGHLEVVRQLKDKGADVSAMAAAEPEKYADNNQDWILKIYTPLELIIKKQVKEGDQESINQIAKVLKPNEIDDKDKKIVTIKGKFESYCANLDLRSQQNEEYNTLLWGRLFGYSLTQKIQAAKALKAFMEEPNDSNINNLKQYHKPLMQGELGTIYKGMQELGILNMPEPAASVAAAVVVKPG